MNSQNNNIQYAPEYHAKSYVETMEDGKKVMLFDIDIPGVSLKRIPFAGMFDNYREMEGFCEWLKKKEISQKFVGCIECPDGDKYTLMLTEPIGGKHMYYITLG